MGAKTRNRKKKKKVCSERRKELCFGWIPFVRFHLKHFVSSSTNGWKGSRKFIGVACGCRCSALLGTTLPLLVLRTKRANNVCFTRPLKLANFWAQSLKSSCFLLIFMHFCHVYGFPTDWTNVLLAGVATLPWNLLAHSFHCFQNTAPCKKPKQWSKLKTRTVASTMHRLRLACCEPDVWQH